MVTIPTLLELRDQIITDIEATRTTPLPAKSAWRPFATALAGVLVLVYRFGLWCYRQIFTSSQDKEELLRTGSDLGVEYLYATRAELTAIATGTDGSLIDAGQTYTCAGLVYEAKAAATVVLGTATVALRCLTAGKAGNLATGDKLLATSPVVGVADKLTFSAATATARDDQDIEEYRALVQERRQAPPQGGAIPDYIVWSRQVAGVVRAFVAQPVTGFVTVYPLVKLTGPSRLPSSEQIAAIQAHLNSGRRRILGVASVSVAMMVELEFVITITGASPSDSATRAKVESAIKAHLWSRYPRQYSDDPAPVDTVSNGAITSAAIIAGLLTGTITMTRGGAPVDDYQLQINELASGTVVWP